MLIQDILLKYWGYSTFRPLQEEIINSVMEGRDTLALLPTGGGKSICFQVPAMALDGVCLVITPLIALMKDQVEGLQRKGIKASAIYSGMNSHEIEIAFSNCINGGTKFLYLSPERLESDKFLGNLPLMKICLIAVDEAHCISQWGYDFRPPYLNIAAIRKHLPGIPVLALTATAIPKVVNDIQQRLQFAKQNVFSTSFERKNLAYLVYHEEDKLNRLLRITNRVGGTGIVYVRNRRKTKEISDFLQKHQIAADYYHAGLEAKLRSNKQEAWKSGKCRIIVATNAFGMGIDKPDVRFVVHMDLPDSIEAYFQEAGRAGRDGKKAYAVMLTEKADEVEAHRNIETSFPAISFIRNAYQALGNHFNLATGGGKDQSFDFDLNSFSVEFKMKPINVFHALKILEREGYLQMNEAMDNPPKLHILAGQDDLYRYQVENPDGDIVLKAVLRSYGGVFNDFITVSEAEIARRSCREIQDVVNSLKRMSKDGLVSYIPQKTMPQIIYTRERFSSDNLNFTAENYYNRKTEAETRLNAIINYVNEKNNCRNQLLLAYFGDKSPARCAICDLCILRNKAELKEQEFQNIVVSIKKITSEHPADLQQIIQQCKGFKEDKVIAVLRFLADSNQVIADETGHYNFV
ncbi:MAG: RecQ family ATP-dependent DNA helicase [Bacteroidales bacterium]